jgi:hypothetical protein
MERAGGGGGIFPNTAKDSLERKNRPSCLAGLRYFTVSFLHPLTKRLIGRRRLFQLLLESFFTPPRPGWKSLLPTRKNHAIKSTYPIPTRVATIVDEEFAVVPKSPTKRSALARIPTDAITFQKTLLRSMTNEITAPAPITPPRPASLVTIKSAIPRTGLLAAIMDQILLVCLRAT